MESGDSFTPIDEGLPIAPPASSPPPPPLVPNHTNGDLPQSAAAVELQDWKFPALSFTPTEVELLQKYLIPAIDRLDLPKGRPRNLPSRPSVVNAGLPVLNPWELPGMSLDEKGRREKYYLTDRHDLCFTYRLNDAFLETPDGLWNPTGWGWSLMGEKAFGRKLTFQFYSKGHPSGVGVGSKTNWIMNVYYLITEAWVQDELVLCHVFEHDSPDYDARLKCTGFLRELFYENHRFQSINARRNSSFISPPAGSSPMHHGPDRHSDPRLTSYIADLENLLLGDPDTSTDTDNCNPRRGIPPIADDGQSKKRKKNSSVVWDYFTKISARDRNGEVLTFAACNHCFKLLTGGSSGGTTHLARHKCSCPCKLQPVAAGRKAQSDVNVLSS